MKKSVKSVVWGKGQILSRYIFILLCVSFLFTSPILDRYFKTQERIFRSLKSDLFYFISKDGR